MRAIEWARAYGTANSLPFGLIHQAIDGDAATAWTPSNGSPQGRAMAGVLVLAEPAALAEGEHLELIIRSARPEMLPGSILMRTTDSPLGESSE
ncbi:MAG: hypothetical protein R3B96_12735 [Pirellulaceae bacterium]